MATNKVALKINIYFSQLVLESGKSKLKVPASYLVRSLVHVCTVIHLLTVTSHGQLQVLRPSYKDTKLMSHEGSTIPEAHHQYH